MKTPEHTPHIETAASMADVEVMVRMGQDQRDLFGEVDKVFEAAGSDAVIRSVPAHKGIPMVGHRPIVGTNNPKRYRRWPALVAAERIQTDEADMLHFLLIADGRPFQRPVAEKQFDYGQPFGQTGMFFGVIEASLNRSDPTDVTMGGRGENGDSVNFDRIVPDDNRIRAALAVTEIVKGFVKALQSNAEPCDPPVADSLTGTLEHPYAGRR